jgi:hypothetical protein
MGFGGLVGVAVLLDVVVLGRGKRGRLGVGAQLLELSADGFGIGWPDVSCKQ